MFRISAWLRIAALAALFCPVTSGCSDDDGPGVQKPQGKDDGDDEDEEDQDGDSGGTGDEGTGTGDGGSGSESGSGDGPTNCGDVLCTGHGSCKITDGVAECVCDFGYILNPDDDAECIVDESCIQLRFLEEQCRQIYNGVPAVALFFAIDFCSGTAVLPDKFEELGLEYLIEEEGQDITDNAESSHEIYSKAVESYVTLVLDASDSVTIREDLPALVETLSQFVGSLADEMPPVHVSVHVFGRRVRKLVEFTTDLAAVQAQLAALAADPKTVLDSISGPAGWNGMGTAFYPAVTEAIHEMDRARYFRDVVSGAGVLTTGTIVVITDADDTSNTDRPDSLIEETVNQVISVGISEGIEDLDVIGRDGSFLAPTQADWTVAFAEITERVEQYPDRAYLLAYCSSLITGDPTVVVSLRSDNGIVTNGVGCQFNADAFATDPPVCTKDFFETECDGGAQCGGMTGCGACANDACCVGGQCVAPSSPDSCNGLDHLCRPGEGICLGEGTEDDPWHCGPGGTLGAECGGADDLPCPPEQSYCYDDPDEINPDMCVSSLPERALCDESEECTTLNCEKDNPENPFEDKVCQPEARAFDRCGPQDATCERGTFCSSTCERKRGWGAQCSNHEQCLSGNCHEDANYCLGTNVCSITWNEALAL